MTLDLDVDRLRSAMEAQHLRLAGLVKRSGVSRAQLSRILASPRATLRQRTLERLARALDLQPAELTAGGQERMYLDWVIREHGSIDFRGIGLPLVPKQPIEDIFIEPRAAFEVYEEQCNPEHAQSRPRRLVRRRPLPASKLILSSDRVVILAHPGLGKTTLLRWLAHQSASGRLRKEETPIFIRLADYSRALEIDRQADPIRYLATAAADRGSPEVEAFLREELSSEQRQCIVLLDGLDEVCREDDREQLREAIRAFIERYPRNRFVLTSRGVGFEEEPWRSLGFSMARLLSHGDEQLREFTTKWAGILARISGRSGKEARESIEKAIFSNPRVRALASNSLMLTILALLNEQRGGTLPRRRVDLYAKVAEVFLDTWEETKRSPESFVETSDIDLDARELGWLLSDLALAMQRNDRTLAARWWIADRFQDCLQEKLGFPPEEAKDAGDRILRYLTERTGLIEERGPDQFAFSHRTLQEYFAAMGAIDEADASARRDVVERLRFCLFDPQWNEVVRLVAARLAPPVAESLIRGLLDDPDPVGRFLRRGPLLALRCLADGATVADRSLVSGIFDSLADLGRSKWIGITLEAHEALLELKGTRFEGPAFGAIEAILETAKRELDPDDYDCLNHHIHWPTIIENAEKGLESESGSESAREVVVEVNSNVCSFVYLNEPLRLERPEAWIANARSILSDESRSDALKWALVRGLGRMARTSRKAASALQELLESNASSPLRAACARALAGGSGAKDAHPLLEALEREDDDEVRAACAEGLERAAVKDPPVRENLLRILESDAPPSLRAGAVRGLRMSAPSDARIPAILLAIAGRKDAGRDLRLACAWTLEDLIGKKVEVTDAFKAWLEESADPELRRCAAQALAGAMSGGDLPWDPAVIERAEHILMHLEEPCPCALERLREIAGARESRRGLRIESVLRGALKAIADRIELAFVFGSTARRRQNPDSDIDLLILGSARLADLSTPLREAERVLGRRINPALYTTESFRQRYQSGDPFLIDLSRREMIPVVPAGAEWSERKLKDELGAMVAERLAPAR